MEELVNPILELVCSCLGQELGNRVQLDENVGALSREVAELRATAERLQKRVDEAARWPHMVRTAAVKSWFESVDKLAEEAADVEVEFRHGKEPLVVWWHAPRRGWGRCQLSRRVANMRREVDYLRRNGEFKGVAEREKPAPASPVACRLGDAGSSGSSAKKAK